MGPAGRPPVAWIASHVNKPSGRPLTSVDGRPPSSTARATIPAPSSRQRATTAPGIAHRSRAILPAGSLRTASKLPVRVRTHTTPARSDTSAAVIPSGTTRSSKRAPPSVDRATLPPSETGGSRAAGGRQCRDPVAVEPLGVEDLPTALQIQPNELVGSRFGATRHESAARHACERGDPARQADPCETERRPDTRPGLRGPRSSVRLVSSDALVEQGFVVVPRRLIALVVRIEGREIGLPELFVGSDWTLFGGVEHGALAAFSDPEFFVDGGRLFLVFERKALFASIEEHGVAEIELGGIDRLVDPARLGLVAFELAEVRRLVFAGAVVEVSADAHVAEVGKCASVGRLGIVDLVEIMRRFGLVAERAIDGRQVVELVVFVLGRAPGHRGVECYRPAPACQRGQPARRTRCDRNGLETSMCRAHPPGPIMV